jgi:hypothetical protein
LSNCYGKESFDCISKIINEICVIIFIELIYKNSDNQTEFLLLLMRSDDVGF